MHLNAHLHICAIVCNPEAFCVLLLLDIWVLATPVTLTHESTWLLRGTAMLPHCTGPSAAMAMATATAMATAATTASTVARSVVPEQRQVLVDAGPRSGAPARKHGRLGTVKLVTVAWPTCTALVWTVLVHRSQPWWWWWQRPWCGEVWSGVGVHAIAVDFHLLALSANSRIVSAQLRGGVGACTQPALG